MMSAGTRRVALMLAGATFLTACEEGSQFSLFDKPSIENEENQGSAEQSRATTIIERDVEDPDVFQKTEAGLWDGRPSLGGVWVAHPDAVDPERVIIRNETNGQFVIGALFRRERDNPGPRIQVSSDAADALGMLAGAPSELNVTALRREEVPQVAEAIEPALDAPEQIETETLDPVAAAAASAIDAAEIEAASSASALPTTNIKPAPAKPQPLSSLKKPYLQIGIFSIEANATRTEDLLRKEGIIPTTKPGNSSGKAFWRVVVGPAATRGEQASLLKKIKSLGFEDSYAVTN